MTLGRSPATLHPGTDPDDDLSPFAEVRDWVFDLDNTLYPKSSGLWAQIDERIGAFVQKLLSLPRDEAAALQRGYYERYGATLRGLMLEHGIAPDEFLEYVHDIDHSPVQPDPALAHAIARLPGRRYILTNGSRGHAEKVAERLGVNRSFEDIFDIVWARHLPKPSPEIYERLIAETGLDPERTAMFEDLPRNLIEPQRLGMIAVLVLPPGTREVFKAEWNLEGGSDPAADFLTENLAGFLEAVADKLAEG
jgi:putative hydrolase of the HAD superfamily